MLIHKCRRCLFETKIFQEYVDHLWGTRHQAESRNSFLSWSGDDNLKSLVVYAPSKAPPPLPSEVIAMFRRVCVIVVDFVFWVTTPRLFIVQFPKSNDVETVLRKLRLQTGELTIGGEYIQLRRKSDVLQNEWAILLESGAIEEVPGTSVREQPVVIELSSDDTEDESESSRSQAKGTTLPVAPAVSRRNPVRTQAADSSTSATGTQNMSAPVPPASSSDQTTRVRVVVADDSVSSHSATGSTADSTSSTNSSSPDECISEDKIVTKMSEKFAKTFLSRVKQEANSDDKSKVQSNLRWMEKKWTEIYLGFHNKIWPIGFVMANSNVRTKKMENIGFEAKFKCECLRADSNKWFRKKLASSKEYDKLAKEKVAEFRELINNETECNRRMRQMKEYRRKSDKPILTFLVHIIVTFNNTNNTTAELTFKHIRGKSLENKMKLVKAIFTGAFKEYEKAKITKWSSAEPEPVTESSEEWTQIVTVE